MKMMRKALALLLAMILCLSLLPAGFAEAEEEAGPGVLQGEETVPAEDAGAAEPDSLPADEEGEPEDSAEPEGPGTPEREEGETEPANAEDPVSGDAEEPEGEDTEAPEGEDIEAPEADDAGEPEEELETASLPKEPERGIVVNPLYADVISEEDIPLPENDPEVTIASTSETFNSATEAAAHLRDAMIARQGSITVSVEGSYDNCSAAAESMMERAMAHCGIPKAGDSLLFGYAGYGFSASCSGTVLTVSYAVSYYTTAAQEQELDAAVRRLVASLGLNGSLSSYEKCMRIYNYLTGNVVYDYGDTGMIKYTAYAALVNRKAVCQGYAVAFYRLALEAGLDARIISSDAMNHAWNIVGLGGNYYYLDSTWDAPRSVYSYCLRGTSNWTGSGSGDHDAGDQFSDAAFAAAYPVPENDYDDAAPDFELIGVTPLKNSYAYQEEFQLTLQFDGSGKNSISSVCPVFLSPSGTLLSATATLETLGDGTYRASTTLNNCFEAGAWSVYELIVHSSAGSTCSIGNSALYGGSLGDNASSMDLSALDFELTGDRDKANLILGEVSSLPGEYFMEDTVTLRLPVSGDRAASARVWLFSPSGYGSYGQFHTVDGVIPADGEDGDILCSFSVLDFPGEAEDTAVLEGTLCGTWELVCVKLTDEQGNSIYYGDPHPSMEETEEELLEDMDLSSGNFTILPRYYQVIYNSNEYEVPAKNKTVKQTCRHRTEYTLLPNSFTRKHYSFAGWNTAPDGSGVSYADGASFTDLAPDAVGASVVLYAQWNPERYPLLYALNGGENHPGNPETYAYGVETPLYSPTKEGYAFAGWYLGGKRIECIPAGSTGTKTLIAKWTPNPDRYGITFDGNGAEKGSTKAMTNLAIGKTYSLTGNGFSKAGYHFIGWAGSPEGAVVFANKAKVSDLSLHGETVTLYAVWEANSYTVCFQGNGGTRVYTPEGKTKAVTVKKYTQAAVYDTPDVLEENRFARKGYTFTGWNTKANGTGTAYEDAAEFLNLSTANRGTATLYAQWQANSYTVLFDPGEGAGEMEAQGMVYGKSAKLSPLGFEKPGWRFTGWSFLDAGGKAKTFANRASVKNLASEEGDTVTLTAQWAINTYSIKFSPNGGKGKAPAVMKNLRYQESAQPLPENPFTRSGYAFGGWNDKKDGTGTTYATTDIPVAKNKATVTLYAVWVPEA